jgi:hypothetical protein
VSLFKYDHEKVWVIGILNSTTWPTTAEERKLAEKANRDLTRIKRLRQRLRFKTSPVRK